MTTPDPKRVDSFRVGDYVHCIEWPDVTLRISDIQRDLIMVRQRFVVTDVLGNEHSLWTSPFFLAGKLAARPAPCVK